MMIKKSLCILLSVFSLPLLASQLAAGAGADVWRELCSSKPKATGFPVAGVVLVRDAFTFHLESGTFFPLSEVAGRVVGGVFEGKGRFELKPATNDERVNLGRFSKQKDLQVLAANFHQAVFLFTDKTDKELLSSSPTVPGDIEKLASSYDAALDKAVVPDLADVQLRLLFTDMTGKELLTASPFAPEETRQLFATSSYNDSLIKASKKTARGKCHVDLRLRLLPDLLEERAISEGLFLACFENDELPSALAVFSPRGLDRIWLEKEAGAETTALIVMDDKRGGIWYSERPIAAPALAMAPASPDLDALAYSVETTVRRKTDLEGRTTLRLRCGRAGTRVIPLELSSKLRISGVQLKRGGASDADVPFIQEDDGSVDPILIVLPSALVPGEEAVIVLDYRGKDMLHAAGDKNYSVGTDESWYPALNGRDDWAVYDLTYRVPKKRRVVSVGKFLDSATEGGLSVYRYTSERAVRAAGFNYCDLKPVERTDPDSGIKVQVYVRTDDSVIDTLGILPEFSLPGNILTECFAAARLGTFYFGTLPQNEIAVTLQGKVSSWRSLPSLLYIPCYKGRYSDSHPSLTIEFQGDTYADTIEILPMISYEVAAQWWGQRVGSATYRDIWLEEGLSFFTAGLLAEHARNVQKPKLFKGDLWQNWRNVILYMPPHSLHAIGEAGPISLGPRLAASETPGAYGTIIGYKGAFVIRMLRSLLWDAKDPNPEHRFIAMMKEFTETWAGRNPTTADFQAVVERHAPAPFAGDMGWFFRQWIDGTALPKIDASIRVEEAGKGIYRLAGKIIQSGVPDDFRSILPVCLEFDEGRFIRFCQESVTGNSTVLVRQEVALPKKPLRVAVNPNYEWLTR